MSNLNQKYPNFLLSMRRGKALPGLSSPHFSFLGLFLILFLFAGCRPDFRKFAGDYSGKILVQTPSFSHEDEISVRATAPDRHILQLQGRLYNQPLSQDWSWEIRTTPQKRVIDLKVQGEVPFAGGLKQISRECYETPAGGSFAKICFRKGASTLDLRAAQGSVSLTLHRSQAGEFPYLETPSDYTSAELRDLAGRLGFDYRLSAEEWIRAKLNLRLSQLNMIPHISASSVLNIGAYTYRGVITSVAELVPFLFPNHWLNIKENSLLLKAQEVATQIVKLDSMQIVEGLSLVLGRDQLLWKQLKADRKLHTEVEEEIRSLEERTQIKSGSTLAIQSAGNNLDQAIATLESAMPLEATALSYATGFVNPAAIENLTVVPLGDIDAPGDIDLTDLEIHSVAVSPEMQQLQYLAEVARVSNRNRKVQWLSSTGDLHGALGVGLPTYMSIGSSHLRDLLTFKDQAHSILLRKVSDVYNDFYKSLDSYQFAVKGVVIQERRIEKGRALLRAGELDNVHDLRDALELLAINHANVLIAQYAWYNSLSRLNRYLLRESYSIEDN